MKVIFDFEPAGKQLDETPNEYAEAWLNSHLWHLETSLDSIPSDLTEVSLVVEHNKPIEVMIVERDMEVNIFNPSESTVFFYVKFKHLDWIKEPII